MLPARLQEGQYSLADPTTLCAIVDARSRGLAGSAHIALPAPDPDATHHHQASGIFESKMHRMHGERPGARGSQRAVRGGNGANAAWQCIACLLHLLNHLPACR